MKLKNNLSIIFKYSFRILFREWRKFILPFFSLFFTTLIVFTVLLFTNSSSNFLLDKNKELIGGDISVETNYEIDKKLITDILDKYNQNYESSLIYDFGAILTKDNLNQTVSLNVIEDNYPLYGNIILENNIFTPLSSNEIYIDKNTQEKLNVKIGETLTYANTSFVVKDIIKENSQSLLGGFRFLPEVFISQAGFTNTNLDKSLLRSEYNHIFLFENITKNQKENILAELRNLGGRVEVAGITQSGFVEGLSIVEQFLILAVLLSAILSAVNIYAGMLYFINLMKKSFAVLLALGFDKKKLFLTLTLSLFYILIVAFVLGSVLSFFIFQNIKDYITLSFNLELGNPELFVSSLLTLLVLFSVSFASFVPSLRSLIKLNPRMLLSGISENKKEKNNFLNFIFITFSTLIPIILVAIFLLDNFIYGLLSISSIIFIYIVLASFFYFLIKFLYNKREKFNFLIKTLISQKKKDGLFGIVSLTSLYVGLTTLSLLILLQATLANFITNDLGERIPGLYILDIQKSQTQEIRNNFENINLFPNVGARILFIDGVDIQQEIQNGNKSREFGREYNLTYRKDLLPNENISRGSWLSGIPGEVSVEKEFADRAGIKLDSEIVFSIQGFNLEAKVTSLRESDSRSGLPFFYFVFNTEDLEKYPATFFGYIFEKEEKKNELINFLAVNFPNISVIDTLEISLFVQNLVDTLLILIFIISIPPIILALFLIITLIISSFENRKKQNAQLLALGSKKSFVKKLYFLETISTTLLGSLLGYLTAILGTFLISKFYLKINSYKIYDIELLIALFGIIFLIVVVAFIIWRKNKTPLRKILLHEEH